MMIAPLPKTFYQDKRQIRSTNRNIFAPFLIVTDGSHWAFIPVLTLLERLMSCKEHVKLCYMIRRQAGYIDSCSPVQAHDKLSKRRSLSSSNLVVVFVFNVLLYSSMLMSDTACELFLLI